MVAAKEFIVAIELGSIATINSFAATILLIIYIFTIHFLFLFLQII